MFDDLLAAQGDRLEQWGIDGPTQNRLAAYLDRLWVQNRSLNLVSRKLSPESLVMDHLLDCLVALPHFRSFKSIADLGSGGGFPALALAICMPEASFTLFEKSPLKRRFLASLVDICPNLTITGLVAEKPPDLSIDCITARAFKPIASILGLTQAYFRAGGRYLLYKGRYQKVQEELAAARLHTGDSRILALETPGSADERHLVFLQRRPWRSGQA